MYGLRAEIGFGMLSGVGGATVRRLAPLVICTLALAGCGSARFGGAGVGPVASARPAPQPRIVEPDVAAVPSGSVSSEPLPPPGGYAPGSNASPAPLSSTGTVLADVPVMPGSPGPIESMAPGPPVSASPTRSASVGGYTARDATGATCRVNLSSAPALDLYKASASGCMNKDLAKVTAWDFRDGEVYLYQPGGSVAARLRGSGGQLSGVLAKSGAPLTMAR